MIELPQELQAAIEDIALDYDLSAIARASEELTRRYREEKKRVGQFMESPHHKIAYLLARLPATYAALSAILKEVARQRSPKSLLDVGAGPGTGMWAALGVFPHIADIACIECDPFLIDTAKRLAAQAASSAMRTAHWIAHDSAGSFDWGTHDLILFSYSLGEMARPSDVLTKAWRQCNDCLVIAEPGTPTGFRTILAARQLLLKEGAHLLAPCPHAAPCPLPENDWCHFSQRTGRSWLHRHTKKASLPYEDEKYSYLVASKRPGAFYPARILRAPEKKTGHVHLCLCTEAGISQPTLSRRQKDLYRQARKSSWGDVWPPQSEGGD